MFLLFLSSFSILVAAPSHPCIGFRAIAAIYRPVVFTHTLFRDLNVKTTISGTEKMVTVSNGYGGPRGGFGQDMDKIWVRDYYPLVPVLQNAETSRPVVITYYNPNQTAPHSFTTYTPGANTNLPPGEVAMQIGSEFLSLEEKKIPGFLEGGNVLWSDGKDPLVITSEKTLQQNGRTLADIESDFRKRGIDPRLIKSFRESLSSPWQPKSEAETKKMLSDAFETTPENVIVMPWMPGEKTGHVDMWLGKLSGKKFAIPYVPEYALPDSSLIKEREFAVKINHWLEEQAKLLRTKGLEIERVPMLSPFSLEPSSVSPMGFDAQIPSTVNWVLTPGHAAVPVLESQLQKLPDQGKAFKAEITATLAKEGYAADEIEFVAMDNALPKIRNGFYRCLTAEAVIRNQ